MESLELAYGALLKMLASDRDLAVQLLPESQLFISKHLISRTDSDLVKTPGLTPGPNGYSIHVKAARADVAARPAQRRSDGVEPLVWGGDAIAALLEAEALHQRWAIDRHDAVRFTITIRCGSAAVLDEVERVLATIARVLSVAGSPGLDAGQPNDRRGE